MQLSSRFDFFPKLVALSSYQIRILVLLFILAFFSTVSLEAQDARRQLAKERIENLRDGYLIVVMKSQQKKLDIIELSLEAGDMDKRQIKELRREKKRALKERAKYTKDLRQAIEGVYDFSKFAFIYDHDVKALLQDPTAPLVFEGSSMTLSSLPQDTDIFFLREEKLDVSNYSGMRAFMVKSAEMNDISKPFPNGFRRFVALKELKMKVIVEAINQAFHVFLAKAGEPDYQ